MQAREWLERTSETYFQIQNFVALAIYALGRDDPQRAERWLREAIPLALEEGGTINAEIYRQLTAALVQQDRVEEASELAEFAGRNLPEENLHARAHSSLGAALAATARGDDGHAVRCFDEAVRLFAQQHVPIPLGEARVAYARALRQFGEFEAARRQLEQAREAFAGMKASGLLAQIERDRIDVPTGTDQ
jgi:tetratricopeptide (TPR) repeat protein